MATLWIKTEFKGVRYWKHPTRRYGVQFDRYYAVAYKLQGKTKSEGIGWASDGVKPSDVYNDLSELKRNQKAGRKPFTFTEKREMAAAVQKSEDAEKISLNQYWPEYFKHAQRTKKPSSWGKEESHYTHWLSPELGDVPLQSINMEQWDALVETLTKAQKSARTTEYITGTLRRILKHAYQRRIVKEAPPSGDRIGVKSPGDRNRRLRVINRSEADSILEQLAEKDVFAWRITQFAFLTGCRASEAFNLKWGDIDLAQGVLIFTNTKNRDSRQIPLSEPLKEILSGVETSAPGDLVFLKKDGTPYREAPDAFRAIVSTLGFNKGHDVRNKITFHSIRHTVATELAKRLNLRDLMEVMGWRTVQMAMRYVHGDEKLKRSALDGLTNYATKNVAKVISIKDVVG